VDLSRALRMSMAQMSLTQAELSRRSGVTRLTISNIRHGKANPSVLIIDKLAKACGLTVIEFLQMGEDRPKWY